MSVTPIGQALEQVARLRAEHAAEPDCPAHPEFKVDRCRVCVADRDADERERDLAEQRAEAAERARQTLEKIPARFHHAQADHPQVLDWARRFAADPASAPSLLLLGPTGTGKSFQAYGAVRIAGQTLRRGPAGWRPVQWRATTYADLVASLRPRTGVDTEAELGRLRGVELLMVDDLGTAKASEWVEETTYRLVNGRYEDCMPSIFTTNLEPAALRDALGDRIASRLAETCMRVALDGPDRRRKTSSPTLFSSKETA